MSKVLAQCRESNKNKDIPQDRGSDQRAEIASKELQVADELLSSVIEKLRMMARERSRVYEETEKYVCPSLTLPIWMRRLTMDKTFL